MSQFKLFFLFSILFFFGTSAFANEQKSNLYFKALTTVTKVNDVKVASPSINFNLNHESSPSPAIGVGVGYHINDYSRVDLMLEHMNLYFPNDANSFNYTENGILNIGTKSVKRKAYANSLMLNGYIDVLSRDNYTLFVGAGAGAIQIKEKIRHSLSGNSIQGNQSYTFPLITQNQISKSTINFAHAFIVGTSIKVMPQVNVELMYSWKNFGKTKHKAIDQAEAPIRNKYKGHHYSMGIRFDL